MKKTLIMLVMAVLLTAGGRVFAQEHEYVDLGLPSGTLWATCNVGADKPEGFGDYSAWGNEWSAPTKEQWEELQEHTTNTWTTQNGVNGLLFTASNGQSLFIPAAGYRMSDKVEYVGSDGKYWSSSVYTDYPDLVWSFYFDSINYGTDLYEKASGFTVRLVRSTR